jgi:hypothetical protein
VEIAHPGALDRADVDKNILSAIIRLDEAEAFLGIEPLYRTLRHENLLSNVFSRADRFHGPVVLEIWRKVVRSDALCAAG